MPLVSVIIPTFNSGKTLEACLASIKNQDHPENEIETIVVDNHSRDNTLVIAKMFTEKVYNFGNERSAQRNFGAQNANGEYFLFLDADMSISETVIEECLKKIRKLNCAALYIPEIIKGSTFWIRIRAFERKFYNATCIDAVRFVRRDKFLEIGGFDETLTGPEDWDFDRRIRQSGKTGLVDSVLYHNEANFSLSLYLNKKAYYVNSFESYKNKWGRYDPIIKKQMGFRYRFWGVFTENGKWKQLLQHPILTICMYFLITLVSIRFLNKCLFRGNNVIQKESIYKWVS